MNVEIGCVCRKRKGTVRKYLVGTTDRWNNAKKAEEKDRVKHDREYGIIYDEKEEVENS